VRSVEIRNAIGARLGRAVKDERGRVLLAMGTPLTGGLCEALIRRGYLRVYIQDGVADDVLPQDALTDRTRTLATQTARACFDRIGRGESLPIKAVVDAVDAILSDLTAARNVVLEFATLRSVSDYSYMHSVNVCVYSLLVGNGMGITGQDLRSLGTGALLHDVGKVLCADLCAKQGPLSPDDWLRMRQHPIDGFEMLRQHHELHLFAAHIAYQHHERMDGSGYPRGLTGAKILPFARIVATADAYDAMTADRPYAGACPPHEAMGTIRTGAGLLFDTEVVRAFLQRLAIYPAGTPVLLADSTVGVVIEQGAEPATPRVRLLGRAGLVFEESAQVAAEGNRAIAQVLGEWPNWLKANERVAQ